MNNASIPVAVCLLAGAEDISQDFERLLETQRVPLQGFLRRRLRNEADVGDAVQETYLRLLDYRRRNQVESPASLLFRIADNVASDFARRAASHHAAAHCPLEVAEDLPSVEPSHERRLAAEQELDRLVEMIERLPPKCQQVFLLSRVHGLSYPEIADRCAISVKMVEKHISRALVELRPQVNGAFGATP